MFFKIFLCCLVASLTLAENSIDSTVIPTEVRVESSVSFETAHKRPETVVGDGGFQTSHKINPYDVENMNLLPTKEKPELNPILSALINEDVMKSIEAKRAIEKAELDFIKAKLDAAEEKENVKIKEAKEKVEEATEAPLNVLTTAAPTKKTELEKDDEVHVGFVDQGIALDTAGTENTKKSRIEIKKGPNGQDYEYEYVYYYEDEEDDAKPKGAVAEDGEKSEARGKSRYTNIERSTPASPADNSLVSGKAKGRSSNVEEIIETERLPQNTRFPSRGKNVDVPPTPALDSVDSAAEKKKISVKRPSLELVDSETFNTDEKQAKSSRNSDDTKSAITIEQEMAVLASAQAAAAAAKNAEETKAVKLQEKAKETDSPVDPDEDIEQTTPAMEKAALDLYALSTNENNNMDMTTDSDTDATTIFPDTTDGDGLLTTIVDEAPSSTTTTTTTTTTPEPTTPTTTTPSTTTSAPSLYGGRRGAGSTTGRNRFKLKSGNSPSTTTTTEASVEAPKTGKNRFSRPSIGGRARPGARTTAAPAGEEPQQEEEVAVKEVKPVSSGFSRNRPRNRFNIRGSTTTTEASAHESNEANDEAVSSTTARTLRARPTLNIRGRSRTTTTKAPANEEEAVNDSDNSVDDKPSSPAASQTGPVRPSRFNLNRAAGAGRLPGRAKLGRTTTEAPAVVENEDSAADSSHHNDVKGEGEEDAAEKPAEEQASANAGGLNRLKNRPRLGGLQKTDIKPKVAPAPLAPRKVNPLLANRRLKVSSSTTEAVPVEEAAAAASSEESASKEEASVVSDEEHKDETTEETDTTTKQQPRGLGLLGQRRRLPLRKPGTLL